MASDKDDVIDMEAVDAACSARAKDEQYEKLSKNLDSPARLRVDYFNLSIGAKLRARQEIQRAVSELRRLRDEDARLRLELKDKDDRNPLSEEEWRRASTEEWKRFDDLNEKSDEALRRLCSPPIS